MLEVLKSLLTGITAFCATNLDDILILLLFFTQVDATFRRRHIIIGQYLGFALIVLVSLPGFFGNFFLPRPWIGLLGIIPIAIGLGRLLDTQEDEDDSSELPLEKGSFLQGIIDPQTYGVAAITFANGGDNIGIYMPLFASSSGVSLLIILGEFFFLVGVWCYVAYQLTRSASIAENITRYGNILVPFVLISLGFLILIDSHTLENRALVILTLIISSWCVINFSNKANVSLFGEQFSLLSMIVKKREK